MIRPNPNLDLPQIHLDTFIDPTAIICGKVIIEKGVIVGPYAVIRADELDADGNIAPIVIKENTNIQDGVVIHCKDGTGVFIGKNSSISHRAIIHGPCTIKENVFVGFNSVVFRATLNSGIVTGQNCVVDGVTIDADKYIEACQFIKNDQDVKNLRKTTKSEQKFSKSVVDANQYLLKGYKKIQNKL